MTRLPLGLAALALLTTSTVAAAQTPAGLCLTPPEAEAVLTAVMPPVLETLATMCTGTLPPGALLLQRDSALIAKFRAGADSAWPVASKAATRLVGQQAAPFLDSELGRTMLPALVAPLVAQEFKTRDCARADRLATLLQPLPAGNIAGVVVSVLQIAQSNDRSGKRAAALPICRSN